ncbi:MAG: hypothetical protein HY962_05505 [Ignavibacteriae bacterium]|nr:hypothetical protein [Ignavibacteriota bacterium]
MTDTLASWHPFIVHFAVALSITAALLDAADFLLRSTRLMQTTFILTLLALPCLLAAVLTGNLAAAGPLDAAQQHILEQHETYANIAVWVFSAAAVWRLFLHLKKKFNGLNAVIYVFIIMLAAASVFLAAKKGGMIRHDAHAHAAGAVL